MPPPPPRSTLFPYTTLFRSSHRPPGRHLGGRHSRGDPADQSRRNDDQRPTTNDDTLSDRKSTRLNSSHITISYAVFCLKKKTLAPALAGLINVVPALHVDVR